MSLDVSSNGHSLRSSVDSVLNGTCTWVVFGYSGTSFTLDVIKTGSDKKEMFEEFSAHRVMYGFVRVDHPGQPSLPPKYVFIYWRGEAAPSKYKVTCSQHGDVIKQFCRTTHLSIRAQNEDDLDWEDIMAKLTKISGTDYSIAPNRLDWNPPKVESTYHRVDPLKEIPKNSSSKDFWKNQLPTVSLSATTKPQLSTDTSCSFNGLAGRTQVQSSKTTPQVELDSVTRTRTKQHMQFPNGHDTSVHRKIDPRDEIIRARKLSQASGDAFEDSSPPSSSYKKIDPRAEIMLARKLSQAQCNDEDPSPVGTNWKRADPRAEIAEARRMTLNNGFSPQSASMINTIEHPNAPFEPVSPRMEKTEQTVLASSVHESNGSATSNSQVCGERLDYSPVAVSLSMQQSNVTEHDHGVHSSEFPLTVPSESVSQPASDHAFSGPVVVCLYNYTAADDDELSFKQGDQIFHIQQIDEGWWLGVTADGRRGLFPANYVELVA